MGQKQIKQTGNEYLMPLPDVYQKDSHSQVYCLKSIDKDIRDNQVFNSKSQYNQQWHQASNVVQEGSFKNQQKIVLQRTKQKQQNKDQKQRNCQQNRYFRYLRHYIIILNTQQTQQYLNHLLYRNQEQFRQLLVQVPYGSINKQPKYTKLNLYTQEIILTINQIHNVPFEDMCKILYVSLLGYKYLYSYYGLFKVEDNMVGFTRQAKCKIWINNKFSHHKPLPINTSINLKRLKQEQSYIVNDLINIFTNKVDSYTIPNDFELLNITQNIRKSRMSKFSYSQISSNNDISKSTLSKLQNNLIEDFTKCSFDYCLNYLEQYLNIQRPQFLIRQINPQSKINKRQNKFNNYITSIGNLIRRKQQYILGLSDASKYKVNLSINMRQFKEPISINMNYNNPSSNSFTVSHNNNQIIHRLINSNVNSNINKINKVLSSKQPDIATEINSKNYNILTNPITLTKPTSVQTNHYIKVSPYKNIYKNMNYSNTKPQVTFNSNFVYYPDKSQINNNAAHIKSLSQSQFYHAKFNMTESHVQQIKQKQISFSNRPFHSSQIISNFSNQSKSSKNINLSTNSIIDKVNFA